MRRKHQLIPTAIDCLESRVVPSHVSSVSLLDQTSGRGAVTRQGQSITAEIVQDFDSFRNDYSQARATYYTSIQNQTNPSPTTTYAFVAYTTQRVSLLAQETLSVVSRVKHGPAESRAMKKLVAAKIMGPKGQMPPGSLALALIETSPQPGTTSPTSSLYTLSQDEAIAAAQVAILNGVA